MHTVSVRLSDADLKRYKRLLALHGGSSFCESDRFRFMLLKLTAAARATDEVVHEETADERLDRLDRESWAHVEEEAPEAF